jgi:catechol 2,3-dioxygenase-like lactoylglutathione lyase family enzyme
VNVPTLRVARSTTDLARLLRFYRDGLGLALLTSFEDHAGFDGIVLGQAGAPYHLEFTRERAAARAPAPGPDELLVFYYPEPERWSEAVARMEAAGCPAVPSHNPYWEQHGRTFRDPDGYRVVLANMAWSDCES